MIERKSDHKIRVVIADDHPIFRCGFRHAFESCADIAVVGEAEDAFDLERLCRETQAEVLLLDVSMPGPGVLEAISALRTALPRLRVLVLSAHSERHYARRVLKVGAGGYLDKSASTQTVAAAIRKVRSGGIYVSPKLAEELALDVAKNRDCAPHELLSNREFEVLLALGAGEKIDRVAAQLKVNPKTVRTYRARILEKMNLKTTAQLIFYAISAGLVVEPAAKADRSKDPTAPEAQSKPDQPHPRSRSDK